MARGWAKPLEESFLPREAEAEETAGPHSRVSGYFEKAAQFMAARHITFLFFFFWVPLLCFNFFLPVSPNRFESIICTRLCLIDMKIEVAFMWLDH